MERDEQHRQIIKEAKRRGYLVEDVSNKYGEAAAILKSYSHQEIVLCGIPAAWINEKAVRLCDEKHLTKDVFLKTNIPSPKYHFFSSPDALVGKELFDGEREYVCKPIIGTNGSAVELNIRSQEDIEDYFKINKGNHHNFLIEEKCNGYDLRLQVIGARIVAACIRAPAHVIGDGDQSLENLIINRRKEIQIQNPANNLIIEDVSHALIKVQGFDLSSIVPNKKKVTLKTISNMAQGGHAIDVTYEISPVFEKWVEVLCLELGSTYFGLDLMVTQHKAYQRGTAMAIEINARSEWLHHTFSERHQHDLAKVTLDVLFG